MNYHQLNTYLKSVIIEVSDVQRQRESEERNLRNEIFKFSQANEVLITALKATMIKEEQLPREFYAEVLSTLGVSSLPIDQYYFNMIERRESAETIMAHLEKKAEDSSTTLKKISKRRKQALNLWNKNRGQYDNVLNIKETFLSMLGLYGRSQLEMSKAVKVSLFDKLFETRKLSSHNSGRYVMHLANNNEPVEELKGLNVFEDIEAFKEATGVAFNRLKKIKDDYEEANKEYKSAENERNRAFDDLSENSRTIDKYNDVFIVHQFFKLLEASDFEMADLFGVYSLSSQMAEDYYMNNQKIKALKKIYNQIKVDDGSIWNMRSNLGEMQKKVEKVVRRSRSKQVKRFDEKSFKSKIKKQMEYFKGRQNVSKVAVNRMNTTDCSMFTTTNMLLMYMLFTDESVDNIYSATMFNQDELYEMQNLSMSDIEVVIEMPDLNFVDLSESFNIGSIEMPTFDMPTMDVDCGVSTSDF